ncbi:hypothetical protein EIP86_003085 [Pleurotus ostreatoroseus]|nr:hypothetical protein EIP86_003085 [Pleurotus ostreatoroseus]
MLKHKSKHPTAQELYRERVRREEEERAACLPPGLINHGNTCFMNSTLQGLIATPLLHTLVNFEDLPPSSASLSSRRSPQLTNGHGLAGQYEHSWEEGMPLGDVFVALMMKAWGAQQDHRRESLSPKELLETIGRKYDQYLDFRQQDAHEFLRHMLDAMRMEEQDIIKVRQPPPPKTRRRKSRRSTGQEPERAAGTSADHTAPSVESGAAGPSTPSASTSTPTPKPEDSEKLQSFVDMLFGGKLASFLVCDVCKKVSVTYEDFNDLSLSIKPEDYVKERKRDRFKFFAKKLRLRPKELELARETPVRSSSVPASPVRRSMEPLPHDPVPPMDLDHRRRSLDHQRGGDSPEDSDAREVLASESNTPKTAATTPAALDDVGTPVHVEFAEPVKRERGKDRSEGEPKKDKDDPWGKLSRRLSMGVSKKDKRPSRSKERGWRSRHLSADDKGSRATSEERAASTSSLAPPTGVPESGSSDLGDVSDATKSRGVTPSPGPSPLSSPPINIAGAFPNIRRASGLSLSDKLTKPISRSHKPTREEMAYMREVLADVHPSGQSAFSMLHQALSHGSTGSGSAPSAPMTAQALLVKLGHLPGIEECLRLFTAVEIMDGENMVGCHRCWKIANGTYQPKYKESGLPQDECQNDSEDDSHDSHITQETSSFSATNSSQSFVQGDDPGSSSSTPELATERISPASTPIMSNSAASSSLFLQDTASVASAPTTVQSTHSDEKPVATYDGIPIPSISTTGPDTPMASAPGTARPTSAELREGAVSPTSAASLRPPKLQKHRRRRTGHGLDESSDSSDDEGSASDISGDTSFSDASSVASPSASPTVSPRASLDKLRESVAALQPSQGEKPAPSSSGSMTNGKVPKSKQVIMRKTFKRYLIAVPPPILVIHLKRFQQISKTNPYAMAFSSGFKKLDDFVSFPEYFDLAPFLAPRKEDFGLGKKGKKAREHSSDERCMYRLYAVVVHIGNMLGGHYVAYTALPPSSPLAQQPSHESASSSEASDTTPKAPPSEPDALRSEGSSQPKKQARQWAYISDQVVRLTTLEEVLKAKAYICMYERI